eukprot:TRINITY_DN193_c1_g1_i6.p1 TRINITY_DN193_c1_g1~~TRINITY_DN193_c1_g1_i6.p1  ORF type:complete len:2102 (+),score=278.55 TRINITY_DN193_c1_g1_i6:140-6445(+)
MRKTQILHLVFAIFCVINNYVVAQLFSDLKLEVLYTDPSEISESSSYSVSDSQSLSVVFSRPVVSLGSDFGVESLPQDKVPFTIDGGFPYVARWVQSYVYRLDPIGEYPKDLTTRLVWNKNLTTWDGVKFDAGNLDFVTLTTQSIEMFKGDITSEAALVATDGRWPSTGEELLPGGKMELTFDSVVSIPMMKDALALYKGDDEITDNEILLFSCFANESTVDLEGNSLRDNCMKVSFADPLPELDFTYRLEFKKDAQYNDIDGIPIRNRRADNIEFPGPRSNVIDFFGTLYDQNYQRMRFQLPRGLKEGTEIERLKQAITVTVREWDDDLDQWNMTDELLPFELVQQDKSVFLIEAELLPQAGYQISVSGKSGIRDAFNVPLMSSAINITMDDVDIQPEFVYLQTDSGIDGAVFDAYAEDAQWAIITRNKGTTDRWTEKDVQTLYFYKVKEEMPPIDVSDYVIRCQSFFFQDRSIDRSDAICTNLPKFIGSAVANITATEENELVLGSVDLGPMFENSGIIMTQKCCADGEIDNVDTKVPREIKLIQSTRIYGMVSYLEKALPPCFDKDCDTIIVWVNDLISGPAEGALVQIYDDDVKIVQEGITDANGLVVFSVGASLGVYEEIRAMVTYKNMRNIFSTLDTPNDFKSEQAELVGALVLDHTLIRPEETVLLKGYIRSKLGLDVTIPAEKPDLILRVSESLNGIGDIPVINYDPEFGTFEANITAVPDLPLREYTVQLRVNGTSSTIDSVKIVAADPRPPTVFLNVQAPFFTRPNTTAALEITIGSLIGAQLENETITVRWQPGEGDKIEQKVISDSEGKAVAEFDLQILAPELDVGETLRADVEYIGPTRECLTDAKSIQILNSPLSIQIERSIETNIPGVEFGVVPTITGGEDREAKIYLQTKEGGVVAQECSMMTNVMDFTLCRFTLPGMGEYEIVVVVQDDQGDALIPVQQTVNLGRSEESWLSNPRQDFGINARVYANKDRYTPIENATLLLDAPFEQTSALMIVQSLLGNTTSVLSLSKGVNEVSIPTGDICRKSGCIVHFWIFSPRKDNEVEQVVPTSVLFDAQGAYLDYEKTTVRVGDEEVTIDLEMTLTSLKSSISSSDVADLLVVQPLEEVKLEVMSDSALTEQGIDTEVTIFVVDKAILDVVPTRFFDIASPFRVSARADVDDKFEWMLFGPTLKGSAIPLIMETALRRLELDPFLDLQDMLETSGQPAPVDYSDEEYLSRFYIGLTRTADQERVPNVTVDFQQLFIFSGDQDEPMVLDEEQESRLEEISEGVKRKVMRFAATPVYGVVRTEEDGKAVMAFTAPVALSRYNVRAYATGGGEIPRFGKVQFDFIVRRPVSTTAAVPRQVRTSDEFQAGVIITISADDGLFQIGQVVSINLSINITNPEDETAVLVNPEGAQTVVAVVVGDPLEVRFPMRAEIIGDINIEFMATDPNTGATDISRVTIPINGPALPVTLIDSFTIDAQPDAEFVEAIQLTSAVPGSGIVNMTVGLGRVPTIQSFASTILEIMQQESPWNPYALTALATVVVSEVLEGLGVSQGSESPLGTLLDALLPYFDSSLNNFRSGRLTTYSNGLRYYIPRNSYSGVSEFLNSWAITVVNDLERVAGSIPFRVVEAREDWDDALKRSVSDAMEDYADGLLFGRFSLHRLVDFRYAVGPDWTYQEEDFVYDTSIERVAREFNSLNLDDQLSVALMILNFNMSSTTLFNQTTGQDLVNEVVDKAQSLIRFRGRNAFVAYSQNSQSPARGLVQSKTLQLFIRTNTGLATIASDLTNFISSQPIRFPAFDMPCLNTLLAIFEYEKSQANVNPSVDFEARSGNFSLLSTRFDSIEDPTVNKVTSYDDLAQPPAPIELKVSGSGEIGLSTILNFSPTQSFPFPQFRGLLVQRVIRMVDIDGRGTGRPLVKVPLSTVVSVELQIMTPDDLGGVEVLVPMPGGLEPVDPNVPTCSPGGNAVCYLGGFFEGQSSSRYPFGFNCPSMETRPNIVNFRYFYMNSGTSDISFKAIAATEGVFVLPSSQAVSVEDPSILGLSAGGSFEVCDDCDPEFEPEEGIPKNCPNDCSGVGLCDITIGDCICDEGYQGDDCSQVVQE